jgi:hypothetical protein
MGIIGLVYHFKSALLQGILSFDMNRESLRGIDKSIMLCILMYIAWVIAQLFVYQRFGYFL